MTLLKPKFWDSNEKNLYKLLLLPFSHLFNLIVMIKKFFSKTKKFSIKTICVGNIYIGGTGKTPLCIDLLKEFKEELKNNALEAVIIKKDYKDQIDEIDLIKRSTSSIIVEKNRVSALNRAEREGYKLAIIDDGLQDYSFFKNVKIVCFNDKLIGNGSTLPAGPLRENISSIKDYDIVIINTSEINSNTDFEKNLKFINPEIDIFYSFYKPDKKKIIDFEGKRISAFAGIGNPENFFKMLERNHLKVEKKSIFPDHFNYNSDQLQNMIKSAQSKDQKLLTTEKDYSRLQNLFPGSLILKEINFIPIELEIKDKKKFFKKIKEKIYL